MKYSINYHRDFKYLQEVDEIIIGFKNRNVEIFDFIKTIPEEQRVILDTTKDENFIIANNLDIFAEIVKLHKNIAIKLPLYLKSEVVDLYELNIPFFFDFFVDKWDTLMSLVNMNVSDIYIVNELGFELKDVSFICKENNVNIRVFPNVAQLSSIADNLDTFKSFFIRPEDVSIYEPYVDVFEFFGPADRQSVLYEIYKSEKWLGDLRELIIGLEYSISSKTIFPAFGEERVNCRKRCYQNKCIVCEKIQSIAKELREANLKIVREKEIKNEDKHEVVENANENETR